MTFDLIDVIDGGELLDNPETRSGRAAWDERGNSIWEWQTQPGVYTRDISDHQLQQLEASHLTLADNGASSSPTKEYRLRRVG
jgi:hypothetical protein